MEIEYAAIAHSDVNAAGKGYIIAYQAAQNQAAHNGGAQDDLIDQAAFHDIYDGIAALLIAQLVGVIVDAPHEGASAKGICDRPNDVARHGNADEQGQEQGGYHAAVDGVANASQRAHEAKLQGGDGIFRYFFIALARCSSIAAVRPIMQAPHWGSVLKNSI